MSELTPSFRCFVSHGCRSKAKGVSESGDSAYQKLESIFQPEFVSGDSGNLPTWSNDDEELFWRSADAFGRSNARLFTEIECGLPGVLNSHQQHALTLAFITNLVREVGIATGNGVSCIPFSFAIHKEHSTPGKRKNGPHFHVMLSSKIDDGIERESISDWFRDCRSWSSTTSKEWLFRVRHVLVSVTTGAIEDGTRTSNSEVP